MNKLHFRYLLTLCSVVSIFHVLDNKNVLLQVAPLVGIQFVTYEITKALLYGEGLQVPFRS